LIFREDKTEAEAQEQEDADHERGSRSGGDEPFEKRRPYRIIIETLNKIPEQKLHEVSARSKMLQYFSKVPMVGLIITAALVSSCSILLLKIVDTVL